MQLIEQTELADYTVDPPIRGNCLAACVASIFEIPLDRLVGVYDSQTLWAWLSNNFPAVGMIAHTYHGYDFIHHKDVIEEVALGLRCPEGYTNLPGATPWIAVVRSPRTDHMHCVVMIGERLVWDPHPQREMGVGKQVGDYAFTLDHPELLGIKCP